MATVHKYATPHAIETVLSTELNSLASGAVALSAEIDNATDLYKFADFEIYATGSNGNGVYHTLYLIESVDGTNFEDSAVVTYNYGSHSGSGFGSSAQLIGAVNIYDAGGAAVRKIFRHIHLPPKKFKVSFINGKGSGIAASGNTVKMIRYNEQNA